MKKIFGLCLIVSLLSACDNPTPTNTTNSPSSLHQQQRSVAPAPIQSLSGMYSSDKKGSYFYDCSAARSLQVTTQPSATKARYKAACQLAPYPGEPVFALVQGRISAAATPDGRPTIAITQVDTFMARTMFNACRPYDFWCIGTEPFWGLTISKPEGKISLKMMGEEAGVAFPWAEPQVNGNSWTYKTTDTESGEALNVLVREEACSDGMSDRTYEYVAELNWKGQTFRGCAIPFGKVVARE